MLIRGIVFWLVHAWILGGNLIVRMDVLLSIILVGALTSRNPTLSVYSLGFFMAAFIIWLVDIDNTVLAREDMVSGMY